MFFQYRFKEQITPIPDPPGYIDTSLINPKRWERISSEDFRYAFRIAWQEYKEDYTWIKQKTRVSSTTTTESTSISSSSSESSSSTGGIPSSTSEDSLGNNLASVMVNTSKLISQQGIPKNKEEIRNLSISTAKKLLTISKEKGFQEQITKLSAEGLKTARDCLDEFLVGYTEGKNAEILAYIEEETQREKDFLQKVKDIQSQLEQQQLQQVQNTNGIVNSTNISLSSSPKDPITTTSHTSVPKSNESVPKS